MKDFLDLNTFLMLNKYYEILLPYIPFTSDTFQMYTAHVHFNEVRLFCRDNARYLSKHTVIVLTLSRGNFA
jgi:hypothetical protein